jgi:hypothetical protein
LQCSDDQHTVIRKQNAPHHLPLQIVHLNFDENYTDIINGTALYRVIQSPSKILKEVVGGNHLELKM